MAGNVLDNDEFRKSLGHFRALVENAQDITFVTKADGTIRYISPSVKNFLGYDSEKEVGSNMFMFIHPDDVSEVRARFESILPEAESTFSTVYRIQHLNGAWRFFESVGTNRLDDPVVKGILVNSRDVTERKLEEQRLEAQNRELEQRRTLERIRLILDQTVQALASITDVKDPYTAGHQQRVAQIAVSIGGELGMPEGALHGVRVAGILHDIGKIAIPSDILNKPSKLTEIEFGLIKTHPEVGYDILKGIEFPWPVAQAVLQHQERMDGSGYPKGLSGEEIIPEARILAVADVVEAMASHRPYRPALGIDVALDEIERGAGSHFDPGIAAACLRLFRERGYELPPA